MRRDRDSIRPIRDTMVVPERTGSDYKVRIRCPWYRVGDVCEVVNTGTAVEGDRATVTEVAGPYITSKSDYDSVNGDPWLYYVRDEVINQVYPVEGKHLRCVEPAPKAGA